MMFAFALLILVAPLYVWRFPLLGIPVNFLMLATALLIVIGALHIILNKQVGTLYGHLQLLPRTVVIATVLFVASGTIGLFVNGIDAAKLAQWTVLFVQPVLLAILLYYYKHRWKSEVILTGIFVFVGVAGLVAIVQYFFLISLPQGWWGNANEPKRAIAFFAHPNSYALFVAPLLAYLIPFVYDRIIARQWRWQNVLTITGWAVGCVGLLLSLSRGGWLGFLVAGGVFVLIKANRRLIIAGCATVVIFASVVAIVPNLRYRVLLPFQGEKSSVARFSLWETGWKMISDRPLVGQGVNGFNYNWYRFNTDPGLDHYNYPHNIALNMWVDYGLLGLISFSVLIAWGIWHGWLRRSSPYALGFLLFLIAMVVHGLIDIPYLKNDLALIFWLVLALSIQTKNT